VLDFLQKYVTKFPCTLGNLNATVCNYSCLPSVSSAFIGDCTEVVQCTCDSFCPTVRLTVTDLPQKTWS